MKREILFRAKKTSNNEWVEGFYTAYFYKETKIVLDAISNRKGESETVFSHTVGQYVGLKDINDVKVFEGDVIKTFGNEDYLGSSKYTLQGIVGDIAELSYTSLYNAEYFEVIGNIYDNPKLVFEVES